MYQRLRVLLQRLAQRFLPKPIPTNPVHITLTEDTDYDVESVLEWDGTYLGQLRFGGVIIQGSPRELTRLAHELTIAVAVAEAASVIDAGRPGTLSVGGGEA